MKKPLDNCLICMNFRRQNNLKGIIRRRHTLKPLQRLCSVCRGGVTGDNDDTQSGRSDVRHTKVETHRPCSVAFLFVIFFLWAVDTCFLSDVQRKKENTCAV
jgi:hypothetical protein